MDVFHWWQGDLAAAPNGDLALVDGITLGTQRVIRRLMTNPGEYIWHPDYGAGIPQRIGKISDARVIAAVIKSQIYLEPHVAKSPPPTITVTPILNGVEVLISYTDVAAQKRVDVSFPIQARPFAQTQQSSLSVEAPGS